MASVSADIVGALYLARFLTPEAGGPRRTIRLIGMRDEGHCESSKDSRSFKMRLLVVELIPIKYPIKGDEEYLTVIFLGSRPTNPVKLKSIFSGVIYGL